jgi:hypothetical protein
MVISNLKYLAVNHDKESIVTDSRGQFYKHKLRGKIPPGKIWWKGEISTGEKFLFHRQLEEFHQEKNLIKDLTISALVQHSNGLKNIFCMYNQGGFLAISFYKFSLSL